MSSTEPERLITVSATVIQDPHGRVLCVRKEGSPYFQLPGGKPEAGESSSQAATREVAEEIGVKFKEEDLSFLGIFSAPAANEEGFQVRSTVYTHPYTEALGQVAGGQAEIAEARWLDITAPEELDEQLAPLLAQRIGPALNRRINALTVFTGAKTGTTWRRPVSSAGSYRTAASPWSGCVRSTRGPPRQWLHCCTWRMWTSGIARSWIWSARCVVASHVGTA